MPSSVYTSPFPSLDLSLDDKEQLLQTADELLQELQHKFEEFQWRDKGLVNSAHWDLVKEREDVRVYHDRRPGGGTGDESMYQFLTTGTISTTLNDAMYGELNHTTEAMRVNTAYVEDTLLDCAVLETILEPTVEDPFQATTVRWFVKGIPRLARAFLKHGDNVYLESTGMRQLSNGEKFGFRIMHSVAFAKTPLLQSYKRINSSMCLLYREVDPNTVQVFLTSFFEMDKTIMHHLIIKSVAEALVSVWKVTKCAQMKKLAWLVEQKTTFSQIAQANRPSAVGHGCSVCGSKGRSTRQGIKSACAACSQYTCKTCRVKRELCVFTPDKQMRKHQTRFCMHCLAVANKLDAAVVARDQALSRDEAHSEHRFALTAAINGAMGLPSAFGKLSMDSIGSAGTGSYLSTWLSSSASLAGSRTKSMARPNSTMIDTTATSSGNGIII